MWYSWDEPSRFDVRSARFADSGRGVGRLRSDPESIPARTRDGSAPNEPNLLRGQLRRTKPICSEDKCAEQTQFAPRPNAPNEPNLPRSHLRRTKPICSEDKCAERTQFAREPLAIQELGRHPRRSARPGVAPVGSPCSRAMVPLTRTCWTPSARVRPAA